MKIKVSDVIPIVLSCMIAIVALYIAYGNVPKDGYLLKIRGYFQRLDYMRYDAKLKSWVEEANLNSKKIVIIDLYKHSLTHKNSKKLWEYYMVEHLLDKLNAYNTKAIATDIILPYSKPELLAELKKIFMSISENKQLTANSISQLSTSLGTGDGFLIKSINSNKNIILPFLLINNKIAVGELPQPIMKISKQKSPILNMHGYISNYAHLQNIAKHIGFISTTIDPDNLIRRAPLLLRYNDKVYPALALAIAQTIYPDRKISINYTKLGISKVIESINFGDHIIPTDKHGELLVPFHKNVTNFRHIQAQDILDNKVNPQDLNGAIVFIGSQTDITSGFNKTYTTTATSYIEVQASLLNSILSNQYLSSPYWSELFSQLIVITIAVLLALCFRLFSTEVSIIIAIILQVLTLSTGWILVHRFNIAVNFSIPLFVGLMLILINTIYGFIFESRKKLHLRKFFAQYIPPEYLEVLIENPTSYGFEGKSEELTVLFADIRNFTSISESLDAAGVKNLLSQLFTPMTRIILKHGGTIDKYVGDMIMAFFGAPVNNPKHAEGAISSSLEMLRKIKKMQKAFAAQNLPKLEVAIGLNTGVMSVGDMGSEFRRSYTVIGDAVNIGSRIQGITAYYGVSLLVGSKTREGQTKFIFRMVDKVRLKGKTEPETVYEVICKKNRVTRYQIQELKAHKQALNAYFARDWDLAIQLFSNLVNNYPNCKIYSIFFARSQAYKQQNPPKDWDGSYTFHEK